jgi:anti-anti-sigma factor
MTTSMLDRPAPCPTISWLCPSPLRITLLTGPGRSMLVRLDGELDIATAPAAGSALAFCLGLDDSPGTVLDAAGLTFIDAAGLRPLIAAHTLSRREGRWLRITPMSAALRRVVLLTRHTHRLLECTPDGHSTQDQDLPGALRPKR